MVGIGIIFICHLFDLDLIIQIFSEKEGIAEQSDVDFEIGVKRG